jgi:hypothetical protein
MMKGEFARCNHAQRLNVALWLQSQRAIRNFETSSNVVEIAGFAKPLEVLAAEHPLRDLIPRIATHLGFVKGDNRVTTAVVGRNGGRCKAGRLRSVRSKPGPRRAYGDCRHKGGNRARSSHG